MTKHDVRKLLLLLVVGAFAVVSVVEAVHGHGGNIGWTTTNNRRYVSNNCRRRASGGGGYDCHPHHHHHRHERSRQGSDAIDLVSEIFALPFYANSLMRQRNRYRHQHHQRHHRTRGEVGELASSLLETLFGETASTAAATMDDRHQHPSGLRYSMNENDDTIELTMEVPGVPAEDLSVEINDDDGGGNGSVLRIRGRRTIRSNSSSTSSMMKSEFDQSFQLNESIDVDNISVTLSSGILTVTAPKRIPTKRRIPIVTEDKDEEEENEIEHNDDGDDGEEEIKLDAASILDEKEEIKEVDSSAEAAAAAPTTTKKKSSSKENTSEQSKMEEVENDGDNDELINLDEED